MLNFQSGMTVISGETGAGKSIIMDALELAIGGRAETHVIKPGQTRCEITAVFDISKNAQAKAWLFEQELIEADLDNNLPNIQECIFRRIIAHDGRSRSTINGQIFPIQKMRELAQYLVDIHGQHEHQSLLKSDTHRIQLDNYAGHSALLKQVGEYYKAWKIIQTEIESLSSNAISNTQAARKTLLTYQLEELNQANLEPNEAEKLNKEHTMLSEMDTWLKNAQGIADILGSDQEASLNILLQAALNFIPAKENNNAWKNIQNLLENAKIQCQEAEQEVNHLLNTMEPDPERLQEIELRLQQLHALARKHHTTMDQLPALLQELTAEFKILEQSEGKKALLEAELANIEAKYHVSAEKLSKSRQEAGLKLGKEITQFIQQLGMQHGQLTVNSDASESPIRPHGYEKIEYYMITNPSQPARPLNKVASGGELSRISLAIEMVTTQTNQDLTRLFDEVDVGIGGQTAAVVGKLLRTLGEKSQILCITHQPQTAAQGHQHFYVEKKIIQENKQKTTQFTINELAYESRVQEIARMLGGLEMTANTLAHAKDLLVR